MCVLIQNSFDLLGILFRLFLTPSRALNSAIFTPPPQGTMTTTQSDSPPVFQNPTDDYAFPESRLKRKMDDPDKTPLLLVACGSFSPITYLHMRMFEMAADYVKFSTDFELIGGYLSPVSDAYRKAGLVAAEDRFVFFSPPLCF